MLKPEWNPTTLLVPILWKVKEGWFYGWADKYDVWNDHSYIPKNENEPGSSHTFTGNNSTFKLTKTKHNGKSKTRTVSEVPTSIKSDFYIGKRQK